MAVAVASKTNPLAATVPLTIADLAGGGGGGGGGGNDDDAPTLSQQELLDQRNKLLGQVDSIQQRLTDLSQPPCFPSSASKLGPRIS